MYQRGDAKLIDPFCASYDEKEQMCEDVIDLEKNHIHILHDQRQLGSCTAIKNVPVAFLPHSCDEWVIGSPKIIKIMIEDLQNLLKQAEKYQK